MARTPKQPKASTPSASESNGSTALAVRTIGSTSISSFTGRKRIRKSFGSIPEAIQMPNLIEVQRSSYEQFLQRETRAANRVEEGIEAVFRSVFPIRDFNERAVLEYVSYEFEEPKYDVEECIQRDMTYAAPAPGWVAVASARA